MSAPRLGRSGGERPTTASQKWIRRGRWAVAAVLLGSLVAVAGPRELLEAFTGIRIDWALVAVGLCGLWLFLGAFKSWLVLRRLTPITISTFFYVWGTSWALLHVIPGLLGDSTQVLLLRQHGVPVSKSSAAYVVDKGINMTWLFLVAAYGVGLYAPGVRGWWLAVAPLAALVLFVAALAVVLRLRLEPGGFAIRFQDLAARFVDQLAVVRRHHGTLAVNLSMTVVKWLVATAMYLVTFQAFGFRVGLEAAATIPVMSSLVGYIPITIGGAGTTEWTASILFGAAGASAATVVSVYIFLRVFLLAIALVAVLLPGTPGRRSDAKS